MAKKGKKKATDKKAKKKPTKDPVRDLPASKAVKGGAVTPKPIALPGHY